MLTIELHRHLEGSFRASTIAERSRELNTDPQFLTEDAIRSDFWLATPMKNLSDVLNRFTLFQKLLADASSFERLAYEATRDASNEGVEAIEFRYSPSYASGLSGVPWKTALSAFQKGIERAQRERPMRVGLIGIITRELGADMATKSMDFFIEHAGDFIAVDLAGDESRVPTRQFAREFERARNAGLNVTIHCGEAAGSESIWEAVDLLGAKRIGHGIAADGDRALMKRLQRDGILIECCPYSNFITNAIAAIAKHPLPKFLDAGIPCSISTDDPGLFGKTLIEELDLVRSALSLTDNDIRHINRCALRHTFLKP